MGWGGGVRVATMKEKITWQGIGPEEGGGMGGVGGRGKSSNDEREDNLATNRTRGGVYFELRRVLRQEIKRWLVCEKRTEKVADG